MEVQTATYPIEILTASYQITGEFTPRGNPALFINDPQVASFHIQKGTFIPLMLGARVGEMAVHTLYVPRDEAQIVVIGNLEAAAAALLPRPVTLVCLTDTYAVRATFHIGQEMPTGELVAASGPFLPATNAEIFALRPLMADIGGEAPLIFVHKRAIKTFYEATE